MKHLVISLGGGVQSTLMALSQCDLRYKSKTLMKLYRMSKDYDSVSIIMADTGSEKDDTMKYLYNVITEHVDVIIVRSELGNLHEYYQDKGIIPFRTYRHCTDKFKVKPIKDYIKSNFNPNHKEPVYQWLGITMDEIHRMKDNRVKYIKNLFPLIELNLSREDLYLIYDEIGLSPPVKSGCWLCPFQKVKEWEHLFNTDMEKTTIALDMEKTTLESNYKASLFRENKTLNEFYNEWKDHKENQTSLDNFIDDECSGSCFL